MRVLLLTRFYQNGQSTHVFSLCKELKAQGHQPYLIISHLNHPSYMRWLQKECIPYCTTAYGIGFLERLKTYNFDVVHNHSAHTLPTALEFSRRLHIPIVATCHYLDFEPLEALQRAQKTIVISKEMHEQLAIPNQKKVTIENGVDIALYRPEGERSQQKVVTLLTRMTKRKEPHFSMLANRLVEHGYNVISVGNWLPTNPAVRGLGWKAKIAPIINHSDVVVGTGRAIREGMAAGCAALVLGDYYDGFVQPDSVSRLRHHNFSGRALGQGLTERHCEEALASMSDTQLPLLQAFSVRYAHQHFSLQEMTKQTVAVYRDCL